MQSNLGDAKLNQTVEQSETIGNTTFDVSNPKVLSTENATVNDWSNKEDSINSNYFNLTEKKINNKNSESKSVNNKNESVNKSEISGNCTSVNTDNQHTLFFKEPSAFLKNDSDCSNSVVSETNTNSHVEIKQSKRNLSEVQTFNKVNNTKQTELLKGKPTIYDQNKSDGISRKSKETDKKSVSGSLSSELPSLKHSILGDLPPLNEKKPILNDLKELMDIGNYAIKIFQCLELNKLLYFYHFQLKG